MGLFTKINEKIPRRGVLGTLMFLACMFAYMMRINLSIIIMYMVNSKNSNVTRRDYGDRYDWNGETQSLLLQSFFYGVLPTSVPLGMLAEKYGGTKVVTITTLVPALLNLLIPWVAGTHWSAVFVIRFVMGLFGAGVYPALQTIMAKWAVPNEKGIFGWTFQGGPFGTWVTFGLCAYITELYGWRAAFYTTSGLIFIFLILWIILAYDDPDDHPTITAKERIFIKSRIGSSVTKQKNKLPIVSIMTSVPFLVLLWLQFALTWNIYLLAQSGPKYTFEVLKIDRKYGGFITGLPYVGYLEMSALFAVVGDRIRKKNVLSALWIRKIFVIFSHAIPAVCYIALTYAEHDIVFVITILSLSVGFSGASCQTTLINHQDLAPNYAGSLYGIMNIFGSFPGFVIPLIIGELTKENNGIAEWRIMFFISATVFFSAAVLFWILGSASIQPWNHQNNMKESLDARKNERNKTTC